jgi:hypothetical protein
MGILIVEKNVGNEFGVQNKLLHYYDQYYSEKLTNFKFFSFTSTFLFLKRRGSNSKNSEPETGVAMEICTSSNNSSSRIGLLSKFFGI